MSLQGNTTTAHRTMRPIAGLTLLAGMAINASSCGAHASDHAERSTPSLAMGFAVDTSTNPASTWGVDPALGARAGVVRFWRDYLEIRGDSVKRRAFWASVDRSDEADPDQILASEDYILDAHATLVEALPVDPGDSSRWMLRTAYVGTGTAQHPGLLAMERSIVVRDGARWALVHPRHIVTAGWRRERVGLLEYVVHPTLDFDITRARAAARWTEATARRFGITSPSPITYYQLPNMEAAFQVMGLDWALTTDRVGGRAHPAARVVFAADPRFGEQYHHEIAHVLLAPWLGQSASAFVGEGLAYWLGGARGKSFPVVMRELAAFLQTRPTLSLEAILTDETGEAAAGMLFPAAAALFEVAYRTGGDDAVRTLVEAMRSTAPSVTAISAALRMEPSKLSATWRELVLSYAVSHSLDKAPLPQPTR